MKYQHQNIPMGPLLMTGTLLLVNTVRSLVFMFLIVVTVMHCCHG